MPAFVFIRLPIYKGATLDAFKNIGLNKDNSRRVCAWRVYFLQILGQKRWNRSPSQNWALKA